MTGVWTDTDFKLMTASGVTDSSLFVLKENGEASNLTIKYPKDEEEKRKGERSATIKSDEIVEYILDNLNTTKTKFVLKDGGTVQNLKIKFNLLEGSTGYNSELTSDKLGRDLTSVVNKTKYLN